MKKETLLELKQILKEEFNLELEKKDLEKLAYSLIGYFDLLAKIYYKHKFGNRSVSLIEKPVSKD